MTTPATPAAGEAVPAKDAPTGFEMENALYDTTSAALLVSEMEGHLLNSATHDNLRMWGVDPERVAGRQVFVMTYDEVDAFRFALRTLYDHARAQVSCWEDWRAAQRAPARPAA